MVARGGTLYRLDNLPVVLMYGTVPAYRRLAQGVSDGPDVAELNTNLERLGYGAVAGEDSFSSTTAAAVERWQRAEGLKETGVIELGRVAFAPGALRVTEVHVALGQDPPGASEEGAAEQQEANKKREEEDANKRKPARKKPRSKTKTPKSSSPKSDDNERHEKDEESPARPAAASSSSPRPPRPSS